MFVTFFQQADGRTTWNLRWTPKHLSPLQLALIQEAGESHSPSHTTHLTQHTLSHREGVVRSGSFRRANEQALVQLIAENKVKIKEKKIFFLKL